MKDLIPNLKVLSDLNRLKNVVSILKTSEIFDETSKHSINEIELSNILDFEKNSTFQIINEGHYINKKSLNQLEVYLEKTKVITFKTFKSPSLNFINKVYYDLNENASYKFVLNFLEEKNVLAGAVIEFNGKIFDDSLSTKIKNAI